MCSCKCWKQINTEAVEVAVVEKENETTEVDEKVPDVVFLTNSNCLLTAYIWLPQTLNCFEYLANTYSCNMSLQMTKATQTNDMAHQGSN